MSAFSQKLDTVMQSPFLKNDTYCAHDSVAENLHDDLIDSITKKFSDDYFCDGDPFGVRRCGTPPSRFCKLVPNEAASPYFTEFVVGLLLNEKRGQNLRLSGLFRDYIMSEFEPVVSSVASRWSARYTVKPNSIRTSDGRIFGISAQSGNQSEPQPYWFSVRFFHSVYANSSMVPNDKIIWDSYCHCVRLQRQDELCAAARKQGEKPKRDLLAEDFGKAFQYPLGTGNDATVRIIGVDAETPFTRVLVRRETGEKAGEEESLFRVDVEKALFEQEGKDEETIAVETAKDEEEAFLKNVPLVDNELAAAGIKTLSYKEIFDVSGKSFMLTAIYPNGRTRKFSAVCIEDGSPDCGHVFPFGWELLDYVAQARETG